jgi:hypothetical protein
MQINSNFKVSQESIPLQGNNANVNQEKRIVSLHKEHAAERNYTGETYQIVQAHMRGGIKTVADLLTRSYTINDSGKPCSLTHILNLMEKDIAKFESPAKQILSQKLNIVKKFVNDIKHPRYELLEIADKTFQILMSGFNQLIANNFARAHSSCQINTANKRVYRGLDIFDNQGNVKSFIKPVTDQNNKLIGYYILEDGFTSTSVNKQTAENYMNKSVDKNNPKRGGIILEITNEIAQFQQGLITFDTATKTDISQNQVRSVPIDKNSYYPQEGEWLFEPTTVTYFKLDEEQQLVHGKTYSAVILKQATFRKLMELNGYSIENHQQLLPCIG